MSNGPNTYARCNVDSAAASVQASDTPDNPVYLTLTDLGGAFQQGLFYAADAMKREMLAVALAAISTGKNVYVDADPPDQSDQRPVPAQCYTIGLILD
jgi:hypothetical protein